MVCSRLVGDNERFDGIIPGKTKLNVDVSLNVNCDERNNCGMLIIGFVFCKLFVSFDDWWRKRGLPYFSLLRKLLKYPSKSFKLESPRRVNGSGTRSTNEFPLIKNWFFFYWRILLKLKTNPKFL